MEAATVDLDIPPIDTTIKQYFVLKTNGIANIRSINAALGSAPEVPTFWLPGYLSPRKVRNITVLRKQFLFYDYALVALHDPLAFEEFLTERKIPAYFLYKTGTKIPVALSEEDVQRIKQLESFKQLEVENFEAPGLNIGTLIEVCNGPFIGCKGTVIEIQRGHAVLEMNVFGRPTRVNVGLEFLTGVLRSYEPDVETLPIDEA